MTVLVPASAGNARRLAERNGMAVSITSVGTEVGSTWDSSERFAPAYMQGLYQHGFDRAANNALWD